MPVVFEKKKFNRVGRQSGTKKVVTGTDGVEREVYVDEQGNVIDNTYEASQIKADSLDYSSAETLISGFLEAAEGSLERVRDFFVSGANQHLRLEAGGYTPEEKVAKALIKNLGAQFEGMTLAQVTELVKNLKK
jgi:hypothetical protein